MFLDTGIWNLGRSVQNILITRKHFLFTKMQSTFIIFQFGKFQSLTSVRREFKEQFYFCGQAMSDVSRCQPKTIPELMSLVEGLATDLDKEQIRNWSEKPKRGRNTVYTVQAVILNILNLHMFVLFEICLYVIFKNQLKNIEIFSFNLDFLNYKKCQSFTITLYYLNL